MRKTATVHTTTAGPPPLHKQRAALMDEVRLLSYDFLRDPNMEVVERMAALREQMTALERRIVRTLTMQQMMDMMREELPPLPNLDDLEDDDEQ